MDIIGHRGARGRFPENTLEGFRAARELGVAIFELDVGMTADGIVVVCHDTALNPDLTRDASGAWLVPPTPLLRSLTWAALLRFDVGRINPASPSARRFPQQRSHDGARVPTLAAVLAALPDARFVIEIKSDPTHPDRTASAATFADAVLTVVDAAAAAERVVIESFDWRVPRYLRRLRQDIRLAWLTREDTIRNHAVWLGDITSPKASAAGPVELRPSGCSADGSPAAGFAPARSVPDLVAAAASPAGGQIWAPDFVDLTEDQVRQAHALGLAVVPWTVNLPADIKRLINWRVDGLISDYPDLALQLADADTAV